MLYPSGGVTVLNEQRRDFYLMRNVRLGCKFVVRSIYREKKKRGQRLKRPDKHAAVNNARFCMCVK